MITHNHKDAARILRLLDLGSSIAEQDTLLETTRVETSAFSDLLNDKVDLIPGTKGSEKSSLFRIFVDFLPKRLLQDRKVVVAHGVDRHGNNVFNEFNDKFELLSEDQFFSFWCIYLTSLAHEQFIKSDKYKDFLQNSSSEIDQFLRACAAAKIPEIKGKKSLHDILAWALNVLQSWKPEVRFKLPEDAGEVQVSLFGTEKIVKTSDAGIRTSDVPRYVNAIKESLEAVLQKSGLSIWLMVDRLDEIFPRRSQMETRALRGLLRTLRLFTTDLIRVKVFLRDDILDQVVSTQDGFTALTHITARQADTLRWREEHILTMLVKRIFSNDEIAYYLQVDKQRIDASHEWVRLF